jgi:AraC family transcriptional regulator
MREATEQAYHERLLAVLVYIQEHMDEPLSLEELARVAHFSPYHFHRIFRGMIGESVWEHVRRLRLERAAQQLRSRRESVTEIAFDAGYETLESFSRAFRAAFGTPPSTFRRNHRLPQAPAPSGVHFQPGRLPADFTPMNTGGRQMEVRTETLPPSRVAFMRHVGPYEQVGETCCRLGTWAGPRGLLGPGTRFMVIYHDDPNVTSPDRLRSDAAITVDERFTPEGEVGVEEIPGGEYAVTTYRGPYEGIGPAWGRFCGEWLPQSGRELRAAPMFDVYLNTPQTTAPEDLLTELYLPLEPR